ncbi:MAG: hypothetical protein E8D44_00220 [Nitrospira sp.]|nr:MAG: hypothetical protein E8D44_00220 [Nitrospira sp.]
MIIVVSPEVPRVRELEGKPVRVAMTGAGYMGRGVTLQILSAIKGMRLVAISSRTLEEAKQAYREAGAAEVRRVETVAQLEVPSQGGCTP